MLFQNLFALSALLDEAVLFGVLGSLVIIIKIEY